jgi:hypothetical protein
MNEYRIRVEKRPDEDFKRYYPEVKYSFDKTKFQNTQLPCEIRWYKDIGECEKHIDMLKNNDKELSGSYTIEIIDYPKQYFN